MKSILQDEKRCYLCGRWTNLECHHVMHGTANRTLADDDGLTVWLCNSCHTGTYGVHRDREKNVYLKRIAQANYEATHSHEEWMQRYGKNYL